MKTDTPLMVEVKKRLKEIASRLADIDKAIREYESERSDLERARTLASELLTWEAQSKDIPLTDDGLMNDGQRGQGKSLSEIIESFIDEIPNNREMPYRPLFEAVRDRVLE